MIETPLVVVGFLFIVLFAIFISYAAVDIMLDIAEGMTPTRRVFFLALGSTSIFILDSIVLLFWWAGRL